NMGACMDHPVVDYSRKWYVLAAVAMGIFLSTIDSSIVNVALPTLVRSFGTDFATVQWVVLAYLLGLATLLLTMGRLGDMVGKKPIYTAGFVMFTLGSVLCGLAPTVYWLVVFRLVQAIGASMVLALGIAIVTEAFPSKERGKALGISGTIVSIGIVVGPTLGGLILDALSWHWIFFVNLPVGIVGTLMVLRFVPALKPKGRQRFDLPGALTLFASLLSLLLALTLGQQLGFGDARVLLLFGSSLVFLGMFIAIELRSTQPMIDLSLFRNSLFSVNLVTGLSTFVAMGGTIILMPFYLENVLGYGTRQVGLLMATVPLALGMVAPISGALSDRVGTRPITVLGLLAMFLGFYGMTTLTPETTTIGYILHFLPVGVGMGIFQSPNNSAVMGAVPRERLGVASGLLSITRTLGQTMGIAILGALWASRVFFHAGAAAAGGATTAPAADQVAGLRDTFQVVIVILALSLALSIWGLLKERRLRN
ncbi:MAG: MFS transporter, partial [Anaerolineae bacterium]